MKRILLATILIFIFLPSGVALAESISLTLEPGPYEIRTDKDGIDRIIMQGYTPIGSPGDPELPVKVFNLLVPSDIDWNSLRLEVKESRKEPLSGNYRIAAGSPDQGNGEASGAEEILDWGRKEKAIVDGKNIKVYDADSYFPDRFAELLPYSQLRKYRFARVAFRPFRYNPVSGSLVLIKETTVFLHFQRAAGTSGDHASLPFISGRDKVMDHLASGLFQNYTEVRKDYELPAGALLKSDTGESFNYVIITSSAVVSESSGLAAFIAHKASLGHLVKVVTELDFLPLTGQQPNHRAEKIRQWLIDNYQAYGIEYVLLIGDPSPYEEGEGDVPMKMCWPRLGAGSHESAPTDAFYADLTGNWDWDGDGYYGEWSDYASLGGVDFSMEVWVGRIPVYNGNISALDDILEKIITYENAEDRNWRMNVLLPMSFSTVSYNGASLGEQMKDDFLAFRGYDPWTMYQQGSDACGLDSFYDSDEELRGDSVSLRWAGTAYGIVSWWGHGSISSAQVGADNCWDGALFSSYQTQYLDDSRPAFTFQCSCKNGTPESPYNLQYKLLEKGGIATVSATRLSWFNSGVGYGSFDGSATNSGIGYEYVERLSRALPAGRALFEAKLAVVPNIGLNQTRLMNLYVFNLYGDPSLGIGTCMSDGDCHPETEAWGAPASTIGGNPENTSKVINLFLMLFTPAIAVVLLRRHT